MLILVYVDHPISGPAVREGNQFSKNYSPLSIWEIKGTLVRYFFPLMNRPHTYPWRILSIIFEFGFNFADTAYSNSKVVSRDLVALWIKFCGESNHEEKFSNLNILAKSKSNSRKIYGMYQRVHIRWSIYEKRGKNLVLPFIVHFKTKTSFKKILDLKGRNTRFLPSVYFCCCVNRPHLVP